MRASLWSGLLVTICVVGGCGEAHTTSDGGGLSDAGPTRDAASADAELPPPPPTQDVDLLFVIDNSTSMVEEQAALAAEIPRLIEILTTGDFDQDGSIDGPDDFTPVEELRVAVVTTDLGTGGVVVPTCSMPDGGDDGLFRTLSAGPGCRSTYPNVLTFNSGGVGSAEAFAESVACVAQPGTDGCGFEQQLEAGLKALSPGAPTSWTSPDFSAPVFLGGGSGHGDGANSGLLRDDSILGVILLTDEADCSASDATIFDPDAPAYAGTPLGLRCFEYETEGLYPVSRYVEGLLQLRRHPSRLVFAPIVGVPTDLTPAPGVGADWDAILADDRMQQTLDPMTGGNSILPSCESPTGRAFPPRRMVRVAQELEARGASATVGSICQSSYRGVLTEIIRQLAR